MLNLKHILDSHHLTHSHLAAAIGLSKTSFSQLCNENKWPKKISPDTLKQRTEDYLSTHNITWQCDLWNFEVETEDEDMQKIMLSQVARKQFGLFRDPFNDDINSHEDVFLSSEQRYIRETLYAAALHGGFVAVIGESGAGKSVLCRDLIDRIHRFDLAPNAKIRRSQEAKARQMQQLLLNSSRAGNSHCLIIEEAHDLTVQTLKVLKRFWEMEDGFKRLISIILIGQPELKNRLDERINFEAREVIRRIEIAELLPLGIYLPDYLKHKLGRVNVDASKIFNESGFTAIQQRLTYTSNAATARQQLISMSYPLVVNNLTVKILNHAADIGAEIITADVVHSA